MNDRQLRALTHPLNDAAVAPLADPLAPYRHIRQRGDGVYVVTILAVDR